VLLSSLDVDVITTEVIGSVGKLEKRTIDKKE
jgi:hypothetical protein